jgi:hypothetical protein
MSSPPGRYTRAYTVTFDTRARPRLTRQSENRFLRPERKTLTLTLSLGIKGRGVKSTARHFSAPSPFLRKGEGWVRVF